MIGDVDALQGLYVRGLAPPVVAAHRRRRLRGGHRGVLPAAAAILAAGLLVAGIGVPLLAATLGRTAGRRQAGARGELTAELVELLRGAPELVVYGQEERTLARIGVLNRELARLGRRDALVAGLGDALSILVAGADGRRRPGRRGLGDGRRRTRPRPRRDARAARAVVVRRRLSSSGGGARALRDARRGTTRAGADRPRARRAGSGYSTASAAGSTGRRAAGCDRPVPERRAAGARRRRSPPRPRPPRRTRRAERRRQDHGHEPAPAVPRPGGRPRDDLRPRRKRVSAGGRPQAVRTGGPGGARLRLDDPREPPARTADGLRRRPGSRAPERAARRVGRFTPGRPRHARRRGRIAAFGRAAPAPHARTRPARRCACARPRRADRAPRPGHGPVDHGRRARSGRRAHRPSHHSPPGGARRTWTRS